MKEGLKQKILKRLMEMEGQWIHKGRIEERTKEWGYLAETGDRRCRELAEDGLIQRKEERGSVMYRYEKNTTKISEGDGSRSVLPEVLHNGIDQERSEDRLASQFNLWGAAG